MRRFAMLVIALLWTDGNSEAVAGERPIWKTNLRVQGFETLVPPEAFEAADQISLGTPDEIVVLDSPPHVAGMSFKVTAFVLDAHSGAVLRQRDWTQPFSGSSIHATASGMYLAYTGDGPRAFSLGLKDAREPPPCAGEISVDGRYFVTSASRVQGYSGHARSLMCDADSCQPTGAEFGNENIESVGGGRIATVGYKNSQAYVDVKGKNEILTPFVGCEQARPRFVSESALAIFECGKIQVVDLSGNVLFAVPRPEEEGPPVAAAARDGSRFATISPSYGWGDSPKLRHETVRVFDLGARKEVLSVGINEWHGTHGQSGIALAPDGSGLAINSVGVVQYFRLPPRTPSDDAKHGGR